MSKKVAPPPMSVRVVGVVALAFDLSSVYLFHQMLGATTTPGRTVGATVALARNWPRGLWMRTRSPFVIFLARASSG